MARISLRWCDLGRRLNTANGAGDGLWIARNQPGHLVLSDSVHPAKRRQCLGIGAMPAWHLRSPLQLIGHISRGPIDAPMVFY